MLHRYSWESNLLFSEKVVKTNLQLGKGPLQTRAKEITEKGGKVIDLSGYVIEQPYGSVSSPPEHVLEAVQRALKSGWPKAEVRGISPLRRTIAEVEEREKGIEVDADSEVLVTCGGAMQGLYNVLQALLNPGDEVLVFSPGLSYDEHVKLAGGRPVFVELRDEEGFRLDTDRMHGAISKRTKVMILNTPHNPTGHVCTREEMEEVAEFAERNDLLVISDDVVWKWVYDERRYTSIASLPQMRDRTIIVSGVTKIGMLDWRIGWVVGDSRLIDQIEKIMFWQNQFSPPILQVAAEAHLSALEEWIHPIIQEQQRRRDILYEGLVKAGLPCPKPQGHLTIFPSISNFQRSSIRFSEYLLNEASLLVSPGIAYVGEGHLRIGFNRPEVEIREGVERIRAAMEKLSMRP